MALVLLYVIKSEREVKWLGPVPQEHSRDGSRLMELRANMATTVQEGGGRAEVFACAVPDLGMPERPHRW